MVEYTITSGKYHRHENGVSVTYRKGDKVNLTRNEANNLRGMVERPYREGEEWEGEEETGGEGTDTSTSTSTDYSYVSTITVPEVVAIIDSLSSAEEVEALVECEISGSNREGVISYANSKLEELA